MLPAGARLRRRAEFVGVLRGTRGTRAGGLLVVHVQRAPGTGKSQAGPAGTARVGLVVSRAVGPAVTRNLVKRRLRHVLARRLGDLPPGSRLVVRALPASAGASSAELDAALGRALARRSRR